MEATYTSKQTKTTNNSYTRCKTTKPTAGQKRQGECNFICRISLPITDKIDIEVEEQLSNSQLLILPIKAFAPREVQKEINYLYSCMYR